MAHTPGPWSIDDMTIWGPKGEEIAQLADENGPLHRVPGEIRKVGPKSLAILEANARLIAAAPDLLEALYGVLGTLLAQCSREEGERMEVVQTARAALAKARGMTHE